MLQRLPTGELVEWEPTTFRRQGLRESDLEDVIYKQPELVDELGDRVRFPQWHIFRQVRLPRMGGTNILDLLMFSDDGQISVVEVKLDNNSDLRNPRNVLAQVIDYAAGLALLSQRELEQALGIKSLVDELAAVFTDVPDVSRLTELIMRRLVEGEIDLIVVCDGIPEQFEDWINSISAQQSLAFQLRVIELRCFTSVDQGILMTVERPLKTRTIARTVVTIRQESGDSNVSVTVEAPTAESLREENDALEADEKKTRPKKRPWLQRTAEQLGESEEDLIKQLVEINQKAADMDWGFVEEALSVEEGDFDPRDPRPSGRWGRLGIELNVWRPGVFLGVIYDGSDHKIEQTGDGADFGLILDLWGQDERHTREGDLVPGFTTMQYKNSDEFQELCRRLSHLEPPWYFENNLLKKKFNGSHPINIRRPLAELLEGVLTPEERFDRWYSATREACEILLEGGELQSLRDRMRSIMEKRVGEDS